jgi:putative flippase GtrA
LSSAWTVELGRIIRFGFVGIAATVVYTGTSLAGIEVFGLPPVAASVLGQVVSTFVSYFGHAIFSFRVEPSHRLYLIRFLLICVLTFALNVIVTWLIADVLGLSPRIAIAVVTVLIPITNYLANRFWVFLPGLRRAAANSRAMK